jgi:hypothetical protein
VRRWTRTFRRREFSRERRGRRPDAAAGPSAHRAVARASFASRQPFREHTDLTIMANALRVADHLQERLQARNPIIAGAYFKPVFPDGRG